MIPDSVRNRWEKERIKNIHDSQAIGEKYGWKLVSVVVEMEIDKRKRELQEGKRESFFNSNEEKRMNRWLKKVLSRSDPGSQVVQLLSKTP